MAVGILLALIQVLYSVYYACIVVYSCITPSCSVYTRTPERGGYRIAYRYSPHRLGHGNRILTLALALDAGSWKSVFGDGVLHFFIKLDA